MSRVGGCGSSGYSYGYSSTGDHHPPSRPGKHGAPSDEGDIFDPDIPVVPAPGHSFWSADNTFDDADDKIGPVDKIGSTGDTYGYAGGSEFDAGPNAALGKWSKGISDAAYISGLDPNLIGGQMWAESRGKPDEDTTNSDGTTDIGLMQISQERWERDVLPNLTDEQLQRIKERTGKDASELDMHNPEDNIIGGALELERWIREKGSVEEGLHFYVSGGDDSIGSPSYVEDVLEFQNTLAQGGVLRD
jgi:hypothetical protein